MKNTKNVKNPHNNENENTSVTNLPSLQKSKKGNRKKACVCVCVCLGVLAHTHTRPLEFFIPKQAWWRRGIRLLGHREENPGEGSVEDRTF